MKSLKKKIKKSFRAQTDAKKIIPGLTQLLSKRPDRFSNGVWPCYYSKAKHSATFPKSQEKNLIYRKNLL